MKNLVFGVIATVLFGFAGYAQTKSDFENFNIVRTENIGSTDDIVTRFFEVSKFKSSNADVIIDEKTIELLTLKNNYQAIKFNINSKFANIIYSVYNKEKNAFIWFFVNNTQSKIQVLNPERLVVSSFLDANGYVQPEDIMIANTVFGDCMEAVEDEFTDSFIGWLAWNTNPLHAITAAVACQGCASAWWPCPPAYVATLPTKK